MTGHATGDSAIEAVKLGALDYLSKPFDFTRLNDVLTTVRCGIARRGALLAADRQTARAFEFYGLIGRSPQMQQLFDTIRRLAPHVRTALIHGETGTGKELVARALHQLGPRRDRGLPSSIAPPWSRVCSRASFSVTCAVPSPAQRKPSRDSSNTWMAGRSSQHHRDCGAAATRSPIRHFILDGRICERVRGTLRQATDGRHREGGGAVVASTLARQCA